MSGAKHNADPEPCIPGLFAPRTPLGLAVKAMFDKVVERDFEEAWQLWPRHVAKKNAREAYHKARRANVLREEILDGINAYVAWCRNTQNPPEFVAHMATWLNRESWNDEYNGHHTGGLQNGHRPADAVFAAGIAAGARVRGRNGHS